MTSSPEETALPPWRAAIVPALAGWIWARLCIAAGFLVAQRSLDLLDNPNGQISLDRGLFVWDGSYYRVLAQSWYDGANADAARFFPLYPKLARVIAPIFGGNTDIALLVISNLSALLAAVLCWRLAMEGLARFADPSDSVSLASDGKRSRGSNLSDSPWSSRLGGWLELKLLLGDRWFQPMRTDDAVAVAQRTSWMVMIFPAGFVMAFAYTESLALALTAGTLLALVRRQFIVAGFLALLSAMLRPVGGLLLIPIVIELWQTRPRPNLAKATIAVASPFVGITAALLWINRSTGDFLLPWRLQQQIRGGFQDPITRVLEPIGEILKGDFRDVYNFGFMVVFVFLGYQMVRLRQPLSWLAFTLVSSLILLSSQVTDSLGRYGLVVVPFIIAAAQWANTTWKQRIYAVGCSVAMIWLVSEAMISRLVP